MKIDLPESVKKVLNRLHENGYEAYAVGGCVRDSMLGRIPEDWDITTSARPDQVKTLFRRTVDTGIEHGTVTVLLGSESHEVTTYRIDGAYLDGRHPESVTFTASLEEDLKRRDFTINAMAYNEEEGLIDRNGGAEDLKNRRIRCVGNPEERFSEDALRMLRAVRFSAQLDFATEEATAAAIRKLAGNLRKVSAERICMELMKLITSEHPEYLRKAYELGLTAVFLPEFDAAMQTEQHNPHHRFSVGEHTLEGMRVIERTRVLRLVMLLHDLGKPQKKTTDAYGVDHFKGHATLGAEQARKILRRLRMDNDTVKQVTTLVLYHDWRIEPVEKKVRRGIYEVGEALFPLLLQVQTADSLAQSTYHRQEKLDRISQVKALYEEILRKQQCVSLKDLAIGGKDLIALGVEPGPRIGTLLSMALSQVLDDPEKNTREFLLSLIGRELSEPGKYLKTDPEKPFS